jgi:hypothetical protein
MGRSSVYTPDLADAICARLSEGESLNAICAAADMPSESTVRGWALDDREGFAAKYARARELQAHALAELAVTEAAAATDAALGRLAFDARRWFAGKVAPRHYGEKVQAEHTGPGGGAIVNQIEVVFVRPGQAEVDVP